MEDGNYTLADEDIAPSASFPNYADRPLPFAANGHDVGGEAAGSAQGAPYQALTSSYHPPSDTNNDDNNRKRINPLKIHLGKRPFVETSFPHYNPSKKRPNLSRRPSEPNNPAINTNPRVPKLIPKKKLDNLYYPNIAASKTNVLESEKDKPVPRLVPKSQLLQFKKTVAQKGNAKESIPQTGMQPMVKFKCRKCCLMSFKSLALLREHQMVCRVQQKEPAAPVTTSQPEANAAGPSRVTKKVYLCSACGTYYENWNLFLHMKEVHNRHICLFCLGMFSKAEKLSTHLINKHNVQECKYESKEDFFSVFGGTLYLMCCDCDAIYSQQDDFVNHDCNKVIPKPMPILVSKNTNKMNNARPQKNIEMASLINNGALNVMKDSKHIGDVAKFSTRDYNETRLQSSMYSKVLDSDSAVGDGSTTSLITSISQNFSSDDLHSSENNPASTSILDHTKLTNGLEKVDEDRNITPIPMDVDLPPETPPLILERPKTVLPEKECGIKIKLSLNSARSPVIINSTVDPTIGIHNSHKQSSRAHKSSRKHTKPIKEIVQPRTPSIKMTICDKADSPFVKSTIYENIDEPPLRMSLNNNLESSYKMQLNKPENTSFSTIYDNKLDGINELNRVPKLTVRVPKELLDRDSSSDYSSDSDSGNKLTVDENKHVLEEIKDDIKGSIVSVEEPKELQSPIYEHRHLISEIEPNEEKIKPELLNPEPEPLQSQDSIAECTKVENEDNNQEIADTDNIDIEKITDEPALDEIPVIELKLDRPLDKYPLKELLKLFLSSTVFNCIYCNHVRKIAVNCKQLSLHMAAEHRFSATVDSITAEELMPDKITAKITTDAEELDMVFMNVDSYDSEEKCVNVVYDNMFECFQCYFKTGVHKDLYTHNRKMHQKTILLCVMCKSNFYSYSELLCHLCPGTYNSEHEMKFRCHLCNVDSIPSSFRLMVHLRKTHNSCDVCLEFCHNQARLSNHVWKHKLHHLCYRCGIAYRNKPDIANHLFWKHGTESVTCKHCIQKKWPHVYHFCTPPAIFLCDECNLQFTKAVYLKVHKRFHTNEFKYTCIEEGCTDSFVSKKLLMKHLEEHQRKLASVDLDNKEKKSVLPEIDLTKDTIPTIDLVSEDVKPEVKDSEVKSSDNKSDQASKKQKKKKAKDKDILLDVNLPELNLSESDSSDESDTESKAPKPVADIKQDEIKHNDQKDDTRNDEMKNDKHDEGVIIPKPDIEASKLETPETCPEAKVDEKTEQPGESKINEQQILDIWDNFQKFQAKTEKPKEKTPPLVPIRKHVCESDHDYCLIPNDLYSSEKKKKKKDKGLGYSSSSSSSSSDSDSSCSCGSNCSCSSSSGSSSSSSSDSDSSDDMNLNKPKKKRGRKPNRRGSNASNVDVTAATETPILVPENPEPIIPETDLDTEESETDEEFYDEHPQQLANKMYEEKRNQLMLLASVAPSDGGSASGEASRPVTPIKSIKDVKDDKSIKDVEDDKSIKDVEDDKLIKKDDEKKRRTPGSKKKSKKKKRTKSSRKHAPIKINIPKEVLTRPDYEVQLPPLPSNKITISLQNNKVQTPDVPQRVATPYMSTPVAEAASIDSKRSSKRRRVPNKFYGYSSDEEKTATNVPLKPYQPPKLEWKKEDLPSPVTHKIRKELPSTTFSHKLYSYTEPIRLKAPIPDPEPPRILMNTESIESSDSDSSDSGALEIDQPGLTGAAEPLPPPSYLNSGTSSLPYAFQRPAGRQAREGESVYCYCRCPYDEVSEMIACDADGCSIEWFHFECVGIMVPPKGKWYCPECRRKQSYAGYR